jgi:hypothetical protein
VCAEGGVHDIVIQHDRGAALVTMHGNQHGTFFVYDENTGNHRRVPSTGRALAVKPTHWFWIRDGRITEHDAVRDELAMAKQLKGSESGCCLLALPTTTSKGRNGSWATPTRAFEHRA